jgi:hypothetical protein
VSIKAIEGGLGDLSIDDSSAVALSTDTFDTFTPFPELATELHLKTWGYAAAEPKVVEIVWEDSQNCWTGVKESECPSCLLRGEQLLELRK